MKRLFILLTTGLITAIPLSFICCNNSDLSDGFPQTEADRFVASVEYQNLTSEIYNFASNIYQKISTFPVEEREKVNKLCTEIQKCQNKDQMIILTQELQDIMGIDYIGYTKKIRKLSEGLWKNTKFTSEEFAKAIRKHQFLQRITPQTKSDSETLPLFPVPDSTTTDTATSSTPPISTADLLEACIQGCVFSSEEEIRKCENGYHNHSKAEETIMCRNKINSTLTACIDDCKTMYGTTTEPSEPLNPSEPPSSSTN